MTAGAAIISPGELLEVLANIDQGHKRWRRKVALLAILGRTGEPAAIGVRELCRRSSTSHRLLLELLGELIEARALVVVQLGQGSRPTSWAVDRRIERWRGVPWVRDVDAVAWWVFHGERGDNAGPAQRAPISPGARAGRSSARPSAQERAQGSTARAPGASSARQLEPARGIRAGERALAAADAQEVPAGAGVIRTSADSAGAAAGIDPAEWRELRAAVVAAATAVGGRKFLNGPAAQQLAELAAVAGAQELISYLPESPGHLGVPMLVDWLQDRWHQPSAELLAQLEQRAQGEPLPELEPEPEPTRRLMPWQYPRGEEPAADGPARARAARAALRSTTTTSEEA